MARDGSGGYSLPHPTFVAGTLADADQVTANNADLTTAIGDSLAADGQKVATGAQNWGGYRQTNVGDATAHTDGTNAGQVQDGGLVWCGTAGGTADAITLSPAPTITALATGLKIRWRASASSNTGAMTIAVSGLPAVAAQIDDAALTAGDHAANKYYEALYDGTAFQIQQVSKTPTVPDDSITLAKMASGTDGTIITYDANGDPVAVGPGTSGQVLTSNGPGAAPSFQGIASQKIVQVQVGTSTTATSTTGTVSYVSGGLSVTITPTNSSNTILLLMQTSFKAVLSTSSSSTRFGKVALYDGNPSSGTLLKESWIGRRLTGGSSSATETIATATLLHSEAPGDTSAHSYFLGILAENANVQVTAQNESELGTLIAIEVAA